METTILKGELINFKTKDGLTLHGFISKSKQNNKKIIIHLHGMTGDFYRHPLVWELAKELKGKEFDVFSINTRGAGIKTKFYRGKKEKVIIGTAFEEFEDCVIDINASIKKASELGYKEIILSGHSTGCQKITYYQSKEKNKKIKALILLGPGDDYGLAKKVTGNKKFNQILKTAKNLLMKKKGDTVIPKYFGDFSAKRFLSYADLKNTEGNLFNYSGDLGHFSKITLPILTIFGSNDTTVPESPKKALQKLREKTKSMLLITVEIKNAEHNFIGNEKKTAKTIINFLKLIK